jgi:septal ring factor EnvC (AmiA/AmiB activator)
MTPLQRIREQHPLVLPVRTAADMTKERLLKQYLAAVRKRQQKITRHIRAALKEMRRLEASKAPAIARIDAAIGREQAQIHVYERALEAEHEREIKLMDRIDAGDFA